MNTTFPPPLFCLFDLLTLNTTEVAEKHSASPHSASPHSVPRTQFPRTQCLRHAPTAALRGLRTCANDQDK